MFNRSYCDSINDGDIYIEDTYSVYILIKSEHKRLLPNH
ncbi:hypothetical protein [Citrobacter pasteurii]|nr:hypothetical protein [Citrobacter pasteurii]